MLSGTGLEKLWRVGEKEIDFYDAKGVVEGLLNHLGVVASFEESSDESLNPSKQVAIVIGGNRLGVVGELHPKVSAAFDLSETVCLFEINLSALLPFTVGHKLFQSISRFPASNAFLPIGKCFIEQHVTTGTA